ncbi:hypothetical protein PR048_027023, partial [Dryococelus australis]
MLEIISVVFGNSSQRRTFQTVKDAATEIKAVHDKNELLRRSRGFDVHQNKQLSALNTDGDYVTPTKKSKFDIEDETQEESRLILRGKKKGNIKRKVVNFEEKMEILSKEMGEMGIQDGGGRCLAPIPSPLMPESTDESALRKPAGTETTSITYPTCEHPADPAEKRTRLLLLRHRCPSYSFNFSANSKTYSSVSGIVRGNITQLSAELIIAANLTHPTAVTASLKSFQLLPIVEDFHTNVAYTRNVTGNFVEEVSGAVIADFEDSVVQRLEDSVAGVLDKAVASASMDMSSTLGPATQPSKPSSASSTPSLHKQQAWSWILVAQAAHIFMTIIPLLEI